RHGDRPDRRNGLIVEYRFPGETGIGGLPDTASCARGIVDAGIARHSASSVYAAAPRGSEQPILEPFELGGSFLFGGFSFCSFTFGLFFVGLLGFRPASLCLLG